MAAKKRMVAAVARRCPGLAAWWRGIVSLAITQRTDRNAGDMETAAGREGSRRA